MTKLISNPFSTQLDKGCHSAFNFFSYCFSHILDLYLFQHFIYFFYFSSVLFQKRIKVYKRFRPEVFYQKGILNNFSKFTGENLRWSRNIIEAEREPITLLKYDFIAARRTVKVFIR